MGKRKKSYFDHIHRANKNCYGINMKKIISLTVILNLLNVHAYLDYLVPELKPASYYGEIDCDWDLGYVLDIYGIECQCQGNMHEVEMKGYTKCIENRCSCSYGRPVDWWECPTHRNHRCQECAATFELNTVNNQCECPAGHHVEKENNGKAVINTCVKNAVRVPTETDECDISNGYDEVCSSLERAKECRKWITCRNSGAGVFIVCHPEGGLKEICQNIQNATLCRAIRHCKAGNNGKGFGKYHTG